ncbi:MAG: hypothetical protein ACLRZH_11160 [Ruthenibacterium lactatiformans]
MTHDRTDAERHILRTYFRFRADDCAVFGHFRGPDENFSFPMLTMVVMMLISSFSVDEASR